MKNYRCGLITYVSRVIITDKLKSYDTTKREILPRVEYRQSRFSITTVKTPICRRVSANGACSASSHLATLNASCRPTALSPHIFDLVVTCFERVNTDNR